MLTTLLTLGPKRERTAPLLPLHADQAPRTLRNQSRQRFPTAPPPDHQLCPKVHGMEFMTVPSLRWPSSVVLDHTALENATAWKEEVAGREVNILEGPSIAALELIKSNGYQRGKDGRSAARHLLDLQTTSSSCHTTPFINHRRELEFDVDWLEPFPSRATMHTTVAKAFMEELLGTVKSARDHGPTTVVIHNPMVKKL